MSAISVDKVSLAILLGAPAGQFPGYLPWPETSQVFAPYVCTRCPRRSLAVLIFEFESLDRLFPPVPLDAECCFLTLVLVIPLPNLLAPGAAAGIFFSLSSLASMSARAAWNGIMSISVDKLPSCFEEKRADWGTALPLRPRRSSARSVTTNITPRRPRVQCGKVGSCAR